VGYCQVPQQGKANKTGEDALYVSKHKSCFAVFDGVGGWTATGVDASEYSNKLARATQEAYENENIKDPIELMQYAFEQAKDTTGTSTACILTLSDDLQLQAANLGDSRFIVVRENKILLCSEDQQIEWNMPYQIGSSSNMTPKVHAKNYCISLKSEDYIVIGTDGLFDNLCHSEIINCLKDDNAQQIATALVEKSFTTSLNTRANTPFAKDAKKSR